MPLNTLRITCVFLSLLFIDLHSYSQGENNIWHFGQYAGLEFPNLGLPTALTDGKLVTAEGCASISSADGNLLFYTDGVNVWQNDHQIMPNGTGLMGHSSSTQSAIIVPKPSAEGFYYIFTVDAAENNLNNGLRYSLVDMSLNGGFGDIIGDQKNILLVRPVCEKVTATLNNSASGVWVITHLFGTNIYHSYLVSQSGVDPNPVISQGGMVISDQYIYAKGHMTVSTDGRQLAEAINIPPCIEIFEFNNETGELSSPLIDSTYADYDFPYGIAFSPDNSVLYVTNYQGLGRIYQYDLMAGSPQNIINSRVVLSQPDEGLGALQLGPDQRMYVAIYNENKISAIMNPNVYGSGCNYNHMGIEVGTIQISKFGLPPLVPLPLDYIVTINSDPACLGTPTQFSCDFTFNPDSLLWDFGDPASGPLNYSSLDNPDHLFTGSGDFIVTLNAYFMGEEFQSQEVIYVNLPPQPNLGNDSLFCTSNISVTLNSNCSGDSFEWSTGQSGSPEIIVNDTGWYWVNVDLNSCQGIDSIYLGLLPKPVLDTSNWLLSPATCGLANGSIEGISISGTNPLYFYWLDVAGDTIASDLDIYDLATGTYTLLVNDGNSCENVFGPFIIPSEAGSAQIDSVKKVPDHCSQAMASIEIFSSISGNIVYSIDGANTYVDNGGVFTGLPSGSYAVWIKDESNCEGPYVNNPVIIQNIAGPEVVSVHILPEENNQQNGQIDISAYVSWNDAFYSIDNGASFQQGNGLFPDLSAGTYYCVVEDAFGCDTVFQVVVDHVFNTTLEAIAGNGSTCIGNAVVSPLKLNNFSEVKNFSVKITYDPTYIKCDGYLNLNTALAQNFLASINTTMGEIYLDWDGDVPLSLPGYSTMTELVFSAIADGSLPLNWQTGPGESVFLDVNGQSIDVDYYTSTIKVFTRPEIQMLDLQEVCEGDDIYIDPSINGGSGEKSYLWSGPNNFESTDSILSLSSIIYDHDGLYTLVVQDSLGCDDAGDFKLIVNPSPEIAFALYDTLFVVQGYELHSGTGYMEYLWNTGEQDEYIIIDSTGQYSVEVTSYSGCYNYKSVYIDWSSIPIFTPNAFTPDGDGLNDVFLPLVSQDYISNYHLYIFDRWGALLFESKDLLLGWDGTKNGKVIPCGVYIYKIEYTQQNTSEKKPEVITGQVVVVR